MSLPWYNQREEDERDTKSRLVHDRADRAIDAAERLIDSYHQADRALFRHSRVWKQR